MSNIFTPISSEKKKFLSYVINEEEGDALRKKKLGERGSAFQKKKKKVGRAQGPAVRMSSSQVPRDIWSIFST